MNIYEAKHTYHHDDPKLKKFMEHQEFIKKEGMKAIKGPRKPSSAFHNMTKSQRKEYLHTKIKSDVKSKALHNKIKK